MPRPLLIRGARQLLTLHGPAGARRGSALRQLGIIPDGAVLIRNGLICEVGTSRRVEALAEARGADEISAIGRVVLPGFVDSYTHLISGPLRPAESGAELPPDTYWKAIQHTSQRTLEMQGQRLLDDFVRHGTTTLEAKSGFGMTERGELKILRAQAALHRRTSMLASTFMAARWPPAGSSDQYIDWLCSHLLPVIKRRRLAEFAEMDCEHGLFSLNQVRQYLSASRRFGLTPKIHAAAGTHLDAIAEAVRFGAAAVDHASHAGEQDLRLLSESDTVATLLPGPVFFTGVGPYPPARALIDGGAAVALATGYNPHTSPSRSMQMMIALACRCMNMTVAEAISAATVNGAHALRRAARVGTLEERKSADLIFLAISDYREIPYHFGVNLVEMTLQRGQITYRRPGIQWPAT